MMEFVFLDLDDTILDFHQAEAIAVAKAFRGVAKFPDAPTSRGTKHLKGLAQAAAQGYGAYVLFVIQLRPVAYFTPNDGTDPAFGQALRAAKAAGVALLAMDCQVTPWSMAIGQPVEVRL